MTARSGLRPPLVSTFRPFGPALVSTLRLMPSLVGPLRPSGSLSAIGAAAPPFRTQSTAACGSQVPSLPGRPQTSIRNRGPKGRSVLTSGAWRA